jgi:hypothetical protein
LLKVPVIDADGNVSSFIAGIEFGERKVSSKKLTCSEPIRKPVLTQVGGIRD